ncbi:exported hypothetical protein [Candidatus Sulfotelmatomonas gaucii]|uniref:Lipoprotein n=1 Tax=Candidatus Sulfuritelmatomonas gaucii TaxID=2043161 RepID=A0A2N9L6B9_9BACT|nr:exported hypothetical protein [Candidatus Sulfotelmatomonas gaucii]
MRLRLHALAVTLLASTLAVAQDIKLNVTYLCNGERIYVENCNIRDTSDTSTCMVAHPDHLTPSGMNTYTYMTRGALKKLLPTCKQPTAQELAAQQAFQKKQQALIDAQTPKYNNAPAPAAAPAQSAGVSYGALPPPKDPEERAMRRCVSSDRLPSTCTGNGLLGMFTGMISSTLSSLAGAKPADTGPDAGPNMAGVFQGAGNWRLDFTTDGVLVNCSFLSPNEETYSLSLANNRATLTLHTTPKQLVLTVHMDGTITGPLGPVTIDGVVPGGSVGGGMSAGHIENKETTTYSQNYNDGTVDSHTTTQSTYVPGTYTAPQTTFVPRRATCPAINLTSKGAGVGVETMETNLLKNAFGGDQGPPTPAGIRMHGVFASASTGFSVQFFPESAILGCGPDAARAYPYTVIADGTKAVVNIATPDHPLTIAFRADGSLDPGSGPYQVHGRMITGQDDNDDFTFAPMERTCNLAVLTPAKEIPSAGGATALATPSAGLFTPDKPLGNAALSVVSGFPSSPNPLANRPYVLLRSSYADALAQGGVTVPAGVSPFAFVALTCAPQPHTANCQNILAAINSNAASAVRADTSGNGTLPGVPPGTYYLMISALVNGQPLMWSQAITLHAGANSIALTAANAQPMK